MRRPLSEVGPAFLAMAHRIGVSVTSTTGVDGRPHTRVMQPVWVWDGSALVGWASTSTKDPKVGDLRATPAMSLTYWEASQDTCTADCDVEIVTDDAARAAAWSLFETTPPPAGFDPAIHPDWESPASATFGVLRLTPTWLRVMPGTLMTEGVGDLLTWRQ
jgi:general stress protein 26